MHKSPGADGMSAEYYKAFEDVLVPHMLSMFNKVLTSTAFAAEMLEAIIVALPKPSKKPDTPANFRPISLLNSDIKIYAKILSTRIAPITPDLVNPDEVSFVKG